MLADNLIVEALKYSITKHADQTRKYVRTPYVLHPIDVAVRLSGLPETMSEKRAVVAAGLLHDTLEDTDATEAELRSLFGDLVADLVLQVTDVSKGSKENRAVRKEMDRQHLAKASNPAKLVKLADLLSNTASIAQYDPGFCKVYLPEKARLLEVMVPDYDPLHFYQQAQNQLAAAAQRLQIVL